MMANKKNITTQDLYGYYMDYVLEHNEQPKTVYAFAKHNNFDEAKFYEAFGSFEALEKSVFKAFFDNTLNVLNNSEDYLDYQPREQLLSFYYTFFENLTANRSYVVYALNENKNSLKSLKVLGALKTSFSNYIKDLGIELIDIKQDSLEKIQNKGLTESAWLQLLVTIKFWMDDTSASFEKTDIFIEKSVNTSFDILDVTSLKSIIDFGKFIFKERVKMK